MALFEMPLEALKKYQGINPKPKDFDEYWNKALKEMNEIEPNVVLKPYDCGANYAECFDLYFTGVGNARIYAKFIKPKNIKGKIPALLFFHGYTANSGSWIEKLPYVAQGFAIAALDCRGQGGKSEDIGEIKGNTHNGHIIRGIDDAPEKLLYRQIFLDTAQLAKIIMNMDEIDETRVGAFGGSQGGGLTIACASLEPRIKKIAPHFPFLSDYKRVYEMDLAKDAYAELLTYFRMFDPLHKRENEIFTKLGYIDIQNLAPRIKADVLWFIGLADTICPPSTQFAAYNKITSKKEMIIYPDHGHEGLPFVHEITLKFFNDLL